MSGLQVVTIPEGDDGLMDMEALRERLGAADVVDRPLVVGAFSAASNVTGLMANVGKRF